MNRDQLNTLQDLDARASLRAELAAILGVTGHWPRHPDIHLTGVLGMPQACLNYDGANRAFAALPGDPGCASSMYDLACVVVLAARLVLYDQVSFERPQAGLPAGFACRRM